MRPPHLSDDLESSSAVDLALDPAVLATVVQERTTQNPQASFPLEPLYLRRPDIQGGTA